MPTIRDSQLRSVYDRFERERSSSPDFAIDAARVTSLLAAVGDRRNRSVRATEAALSRPGITRAEQVAIVRAGLTNAERADLAFILDKGKVPLTDDVRALLGEVLGRAPTPTPDTGLLIDGEHGGMVRGTAQPGAVIEVINLSTAPEKRLHTNDTFVLATADAQGNFTGNIPDLAGGDLVRLRLRDPNGTVSEWTQHVAGGRDTRNAQAALFRVGVSPESGGRIAVTNINASRQISEPGAKVLFLNERTGERTVFTMNAEGTFAAGTTAPGRAGDTFSVRVTDGRNNADFATEVGKIRVPGAGGGGGHNVDLPDPALHRDELDSEGKPRFSTRRFSGPLFRDSAKPEDVKQGQIGDCYLPSAIAAVAAARPGLFERLVKDNGDGTYSVTFKRYDWSKQRFLDEVVKVDADFYVRSYGGPLYGASSGATSEAGMELWWPIVEKAYAVWKGDYDRIGSGGSSSDVFEAVLGQHSDDLSITQRNTTEVWRKIRASVDNHLPVSAGTYGESQDALYTNTGVYSDHSYTVLGYAERDGVRYVRLRNPWGESEPYPGDGKNDGIFELKLEEFARLYSTLYTVR